MGALDHGRSHEGDSVNISTVKYITVTYKREGAACTWLEAAADLANYQAGIRRKNAPAAERLRKRMVRHGLL